MQNLQVLEERQISGQSRAGDLRTIRNSQSRECVFHLVQMLQATVAKMQIIVKLDGFESRESVDVAKSAGIDASFGAVYGFDSRLSGEVDERVVIGVPRGAIRDLTRAAAPKQPLGA